MKVLLLNGSSHRNGCTFTALDEVARALKNEHIDTEIYQLGNPELRDCTGCQACRQIGKCVYNDVVNEFVEKAKTLTVLYLELLFIMHILQVESYLFWIEPFIPVNLLLNISLLHQ